MRNRYLLPVLFLASLVLTTRLTAQPITWEQINSPSPNDPILCMMATPDGSIYLSSQGYGLFRSTNGGSSWAPCGTLPSFSPVYSMAYTPGGAVLVASSDGLYRSTDNGGSWAQLPLFQGTYVDGVAAISDEIYVATAFEQGIYRSTDAGASWTRTLSIQGAQGLGHGNGAIYAGIRDGGARKSTDNGATWSETGLTVEDATLLAVGTDGAVVAGVRMAMGAGMVLRSSNGGASWSSGTLADVVTALVPLPEGKFAAAAANSGFYRSTDGGRSWTQYNMGLTDVRMFALTFHRSGRLYCGNVFGGVFRTTDAVAGVVEPVSAEALSLRARPNPTPGAATVTVGMPSAGRARLSLVNTRGELVRALLDESLPAGATTIPVDLADQPAGIYFLRLIAEGSEVATTTLAIE